MAHATQAEKHQVSNDEDLENTNDYVDDDDEEEAQSTPSPTEVRATTMDELSEIK